MPPGELERIAVLETKMDRVEREVIAMRERQEEMYLLLTKGKGMWRLLLLIVGAITFLVNVGVNIAPWFFHGGGK